MDKPEVLLVVCAPIEYLMAESSVPSFEAPCERCKVIVRVSDDTFEQATAHGPFEIVCFACAQEEVETQKAAGSPVQLVPPSAQTIRAIRDAFARVAKNKSR